VHNDPVLALLIGKHDGQQLVLHMHNDHLGLPALRPLVSLLLQRTAMVLCVSNFIRDRARQAFPAHADRIHTVLNATNPELFARQPVMGARADQALPLDLPASTDAPFHFLFVGRLTEDKGVHVLIEAFKRVHRQHPQTRLMIVGSSFFADAPRTPYQDQLVEQAIPIADAIVFTGFLPHEQLRGVYAQADVVVIPSTWQEPFGLVGLEAMSAQRCVIASRVGGLPELITHERTGLLVQPDDVPALAEVMSRVVQDAGLRTRLGLAAWGDVQRRFAYPRLVQEVTERIGALV
jgi:spore coat protein SA